MLLSIFNNNNSILMFTCMLNLVFDTLNQIEFNLSKIHDLFLLFPSHTDIFTLLCLIRGDMVADSFPLKHLSHLLRMIVSCRNGMQNGQRLRILRKSRHFRSSEILCLKLLLELPIGLTYPPLGLLVLCLPFYQDQ